MKCKQTRAIKRLMPLLLILVLIVPSISQVAYAAGFSAIVTSDSMPVYSDLEMNNPIGVLSKGTIVVVYRYAGNVAAIACPTNGAAGIARVSDMVAVASIAKKAVVSVSGAKVYQEASASSASGDLKKGTKLYVLAINGEWAMVESGSGVVGYMYTSQLYIEGMTTSPDPTPTVAPPSTEPTTEEKAAVVAVSGARVYQKANASSRSLALEKGFALYVVAINGNWAMVRNGSSIGYMLVSQLYIPGVSTSTPEPDPTAAPTPAATEPVEGKQAMVVASDARVYQRPSASSVSMQVSYGMILTVRAISGDWAMVQNGRYTAFMYVSQLYIPGISASTPAPTATVAPVPTLKPFSSSDKVVTVNQPAIVNESVTMYKSASEASKALGVLPTGTTVTVRAYSPVWALIEVAGQGGFCDLSKLTPAVVETPTPTVTPTVAPTPTPTVPVENSTKFTVTASPGLIVYKSFSTRSTKIGVVLYGSEVNVIANNSEWAFIEQNGNYGFCKFAGLTLTSMLPSVPENPDDGFSDGNVIVKQFDATVIHPSTKVYASASASSASTTLPMGTEVTVYAYNSTYAYIGKGNARGYVEWKYLSNASYTTMSSGSSGSDVLTLQKMLETLGFFDGEPAGTYSSLTQLAVARFQAAAGMSATGVADLHTLRVLAGGYAPASPLLSLNLSAGSSGENVQRLQTRLYYKGYLSKTSSVDGDYGSITTSAIKLFQTAVGMSATGVADSKTIRALYSTNAPKYAGTTPADGTGGGTGGGTPTLPSDPSRAEKIEYAISIGYQQLGKPYVYGATGTSSFDCSGFTTYCYKKVGVSMGRTAYAQGYNAGAKIEGISNLARGDIVCFNTVADNDLSDHVGIYLGNYQFIHASSGAGKVVISSLQSGYYNNKFSWGRRVL